MENTGVMRSPGSRILPWGDLSEHWFVLSLDTIDRKCEFGSLGLIWYISILIHSHIVTSRLVSMILIDIWKQLW